MADEKITAMTPLPFANPGNATNLESTDLLAIARHGNLTNFNTTVADLRLFVSPAIIGPGASATAYPATSILLDAPFKVIPGVNVGTLSLGLAATTQQTPAGNGPPSTGTPLMAGLAGTFTPAATGKVLILLASTVQMPGGTGTLTLKLRIGTGAAPANGAAETGTQIDQQQTLQIPGATGKQITYSTLGLATGLAVGTPIWIDVSMNASVAGTDLENTSVNIVCLELPA